MKIQKSEYFENVKSFLDETKNIFHNYLTIIIQWKIKNSGHKLWYLICCQLQSVFLQKKKTSKNEKYHSNNFENLRSMTFMLLLGVLGTKLIFFHTY